MNAGAPIRHLTSRRIIIFGFIMALCLSAGDDLRAQRTKSSLRAARQIHAEKGLKDNRYFFYFINNSITNFGTDEERQLFKEAIQRDMIAQQLFMKFLFGDSFSEVLKAQKILIDLYRATIARDVAEGKKMLNGFAPAVVKSKDNRARHYLHLGYRDIEMARLDMGMADNFRESLYSMRLYHYVKAIKEAKHGKRYALYANIEAAIHQGEKPALGIMDFDRLKELITRTSPADLKEYHLLVHTDNYYKSKDTLSYFDRIWEQPNLDEIKEYKEYLEKQ